MEINRVQYTDLLKIGGNFVSLDISKTGTGWVRKIGEKLEQGTKSFKEYNDVETRHYFKEFVKELFGDNQFDFVCIEDVIGGTNFRTNKVLYQLNPIVDDMMYEGIIKSCKVERIDNMQWKKTLRQLSGVELPTKNMESKAEIRLHLGALGVEVDAHRQDEMDALGMALAVIYRRSIGQETGKQAKLHMDLSKSYKLKEFATNEEMLKGLAKLTNKVGYENKEIEVIEWMKTSNKRYKDITGMFKKRVITQGTDSSIYAISVPLGKLGIIGVKKGIGLGKENFEDMVYFIAYLPVKKKG